MLIYPDSFIGSNAILGGDFILYNPYSFSSTMASLSIRRREVIAITKYFGLDYDT